MNIMGVPHQVIPHRASSTHQRGIPRQERSNSMVGHLHLTPNIHLDHPTLRTLRQDMLSHMAHQLHNMVHQLHITDHQLHNTAHQPLLMDMANLSMPIPDPILLGHLEALKIADWGRSSAEVLERSLDMRWVVAPLGQLRVQLWGVMG